MAKPREWRSPQGIADHYGVTRRTVEKWNRAGWIRSYRMGGVVRYDLHEVEAVFTSGAYSGLNPQEAGSA